MKYRKFLSDSNNKTFAVKDLNIIDSSTISLFSDILKGVGRKSKTGKNKDGIKIHTMINALEDVPCLVRMTSVATSDSSFLKHLELKTGSIIVFDKDYNDYTKYAQWRIDGIYFVMRQRENAVYKSMVDFDIPDNIHLGIIRDEKIEVTKNGNVITFRRIAYWHEGHNKVYEFITNNFDLEADKIAEIYKH
jgi:hypothetical protein